MLESLGETNREELNMHQCVNITKLCMFERFYLHFRLTKAKSKIFYNREIEAIHYDIVEIAI
jgi:hypothetical protein